MATDVITDGPFAGLALHRQDSKIFTSAARSAGSIQIGVELTDEQVLQVQRMSVDELMIRCHQAKGAFQGPHQSSWMYYRMNNKASEGHMELMRTFIGTQPQCLLGRFNRVTKKIEHDEGETQPGDASLSVGGAGSVEEPSGPTNNPNAEGVHEEPQAA